MGSPTSILLRRLTAENVCSSATVVRIHDSAHAKKYAMLSVTLVVSKFVDHSYGLVDKKVWLCGSVLVARTAHLIVT